MTETGIEVITANVPDHDPDLDHPISKSDTATLVEVAVAAETVITETHIAAEMVCHRFMVAMTNINREVKTIHK